MFCSAIQGNILKTSQLEIRTQQIQQTHIWEKAMRTKSLLMLIVITAFVVTCSKKSDNPTTPTNDPTNGGDEPTVSTSFVLEKHTVSTDIPSAVKILFQVKDLAGKGVDFLTVDRFLIEEEGQRLNNSTASAYILKKSDLPYTVRTNLLIDNNAGSNLDALKKGAIRFVQTIDTQQEIAIYSVSDKLELVMDYTSDANALTGAINGIAEGGAQCNLYTAIIDAKRGANEYEPNNIVQRTHVIFTDSNDDGGNIPQEFIAGVTSPIQIFTIGRS